jgi:hypothetical protein
MPETERARPGRRTPNSRTGATTPDNNSSGGDGRNTRTAGPTIHGAVVIDLRGVDPHTAARDLQWATEAPAGADVILIVAPGQHPPWAALAYLIDHGQHLASITIHGSDPETVAGWVQQLREVA